MFQIHPNLLSSFSSMFFFSFSKLESPFVYSLIEGTILLKNSIFPFFKKHMFQIHPNLLSSFSSMFFFSFSKLEIPLVFHFLAFIFFPPMIFIHYLHCNWKEITCVYSISFHISKITSSPPHIGMLHFPSTKTSHRKCFVATDLE